MTGVPLDPIAAFCVAALVLSLMIAAWSVWK